MLKRLVLIIALVWIAQPAQARSADARIRDFCSALTGRDITSIYTRSALQPFFTSENDLSKFIVQMNVQMDHAGFHRFTVERCTVAGITVSGTTTQGTLKITGEGPLFFLKSRLRLSTEWSNTDSGWYIDVPQVISPGD